MIDREIVEQIQRNKELESFLRKLSANLPAFSEATRKKVFNEFARPEAKDLLPAFRRASFESMALDLANSLQVSAPAKLNESRNSFHREIAFDKFLVTGHYVPHPYHVVRRANFRQTLAASSQLSLFKDNKHDVDGGHTFGVILYGESYDEMSDTFRPFLRFAVPDKNFSGYVGNVDVMKMFERDNITNNEIEIVKIEDNIKPIFFRTDQQKEI